MLKYSPANTKLKKIPFTGKVYSLDLLAGYSCPFAKDCKSKVVIIDGQRKVKDSPSCKFRCYAVSLEALYPHTFSLHKSNFECIKSTRGVNNLTNLMDRTLPIDASIIRFHTAGDFFKKEYFQAACKLAEKHPDIKFYAYTKALPFWIECRREVPPNFILTASYGGTHDFLIEKYRLKNSRVLFTKKSARSLSLPVSSTELHALTNRGNFALLLHGTQPKGVNSVWKKIKQKQK